jgi:DNA-binding NarL/FixJ family response regulator
MGALAAIRQADREARALMLSTYGNEEEVYRALHAGAAGYVLKDAGRENSWRLFTRCTREKDGYNLQFKLWSPNEPTGPS